MRVLITGSREWGDEDKLAEAIIEWIGDYSPGQVTIVHGACPRGADEIAGRLARVWGVAEERHPADWEKHGKAAGFIRNQQMVELGADVVLAFPLGRSPGTRDCMRRAHAARLRVINHGDS